MSRTSHLSADERQRVNEAARAAMLSPGLWMSAVGFAVFKVGTWMHAPAVLPALAGLVCLAGGIIAIVMGYNARNRACDDIEWERYDASQRARQASEAAAAAATDKAAA